jgi:hypothetical protein
MNRLDLKSFLSFSLTVLLAFSTFGFARNTSGSDSCLCCGSNIEKSDCCCKNKHNDQVPDKSKTFCRCAVQPVDTKPFVIENPSVRIMVYPASVSEVQFLMVDSRNDFLGNISFHSPPNFHFSGHSLPLLI